MFETEVRRDGAPARAAVEALPAGGQQAKIGRSPLSRADRWFPYILFAGVAGVVVLVSVLAHAYLTLLHPFHRHLQGDRWVDAFGWWDGWWYVGIARRGYWFFRPDRQSPVAFFPAYPMAMQYVGRVVGGPLVAGFLVTVACGLGVAVLFHRWCVLKLGSAKARLALALLLLYPFAFYLMGAVYADALFIVGALAAFLALEHDRPILAGLAALVATSARPVGTALILGLWVLYLERKGVFRPREARFPGQARLFPAQGAARALLPAQGAARARFPAQGAARALLPAQGAARAPGRPRAADAGLLLAPIGMVAFCLFLWSRFGEPFAFFDVAGAPGWDQPPGAHTWFKVHWIKAMWNGPWTNGHFGHLFINALATVVTAAFIPLVFRRLGWGYGVYVVIAVLATAAATKDFVGMGRYSIAAFPCFAMAADVLFRRPRLAWAVVGVSGVGLVILSQLHARGTIIS